MKIGLFTATFLDMKIEQVFNMACDLGYEAVEMPAFVNNPHLDIEEDHQGTKRCRTQAAGQFLWPDHLSSGQSSGRPNCAWALTEKTRTQFSRGPRKKRSNSVPNE